jgi:putative glycosyltransferase (TIGR04372 family)
MMTLTRIQIQILRVLVGALVRIQLIQIVALSTKGRLTMFIERIEPEIRLRSSVSRWRLPWIICIEPCESPNAAVREYFSRSVFFVRSAGPGLIYRLLAPLSMRRGKNIPDIWEYPIDRSRSVGSRRDLVSLLELLGLPVDAPFVVLSTRDARYYRAIREAPGQRQPGPEVAEETMVRNSEIDTYFDACLALRARGYSIIRIGVDQTPLSVSLWGDTAVDYATHSRTPERDLLLARSASFLLNGGSGAWSLVALFNRPQLSTNLYVPFWSRAVMTESLFSHQLQRDLATGRLRSFREMAATGASAAYEQFLTRSGIELVQHSPSELSAMACEMADRLEGRFKETAHDLRCHDRFNEIRRHSMHFQDRGRISTVFLRAHEDLLS